MPWFVFTKYGAPDIPEPENPVSTGQICLYPSALSKSEDGTSFVVAPPHGYLRCDGSEVPIANYQDLYDFFNNLGVSFLPAASPGFFRLPNLSSRFPVGLDTSDSDFDAIGKTGGSSSHTHTALASHTHPTPVHTHSVADHTHSYGNHTHTLPSHTHSAGTLSASANSAANTVRIYSASDRRVAKPYHNHDVIGTSGSANGDTGYPKDSSNNDKNTTSSISGAIPTTSATTDVSLGGPSSTVTLQSFGGVDSIPPYYAMYYVIKV